MASCRDEVSCFCDTYFNHDAPELQVGCPAALKPLSTALADSGSVTVLRCVQSWKHSQSVITRICTVHCTIIKMEVREEAGCQRHVSTHSSHSSPA